jgi:hypothetical protein
MAYIWLRGEDSSEYGDSMDQYAAEARRNDTSITRLHHQAPETFGFATPEELRRIEEGVERYGLYGGHYSDGVRATLQRVEEDPVAVDQLRAFLGDRHVVLLDLIAIALDYYQKGEDEDQRELQAQ